MTKTFDEGKNLSKEMHVLQAIQWGISAWEFNVTKATIQACWSQSQCVNFDQFSQPPLDHWTESAEELNSIQQILYKMRNKEYILDVSSNIQEYISLYSDPWSERVDDEDNSEKLVDDIVSHYLSEEIENDEDQTAVSLPPITHCQALDALHTLQRYEEEHAQGNSELLYQLQVFERELSHRRTESAKQVRLDRWFGAKKGELSWYKGYKIDSCSNSLL